VSKTISVYNGISNGALLREVDIEDIIGTTTDLEESNMANNNHEILKFCQYWSSNHVIS
jgi:hypothetical protein